ncbi:MAG: HNH endonuclease [Candidatus Woesearchaeota archaeon]
MDKKEFEEKTFIDYKGYKRWKVSNESVHRTIAKREIWAKNRKKYPYDFQDYQVHHRDRNKLNNRIENLELIPRIEHEYKHKIIRHEYRLINALIAIIFLSIAHNIFLFFAVKPKIDINIIRLEYLIFIFLFLFSIWFFNRKKKGEKYV